MTIKSYVNKILNFFLLRNWSWNWPSAFHSLASSIGEKTHLKIFLLI